MCITTPSCVPEFLPQPLPVLMVISPSDFSRLFGSWVLRGTQRSPAGHQGSISVSDDFKNLLNGKPGTFPEGPSSFGWRMSISQLPDPRQPQWQSQTLLGERPRSLPCAGILSSPGPASPETWPGLVLSWLVCFGLICSFPITAWVWIHLPKQSCESVCPCHCVCESLTMGFTLKHYMGWRNEE